MNTVSSVQKPNRTSPEDVLLTVMEGPRVLSFSYTGIMNYHGGAMPAGVALAFRLFEHLFSVYENRFHTPPGRGEASFFSGLGENGQGILDTADILLRIRKYHALLDEPVIPAAFPAPEAPGGGSYYFSGTLGEMSWAAALRGGLVSPAFFNASREMHRKKDARLPVTDREIQNLQQLRQNTEKALLSLSSEEIFQFMIGV